MLVRTVKLPVAPVSGSTTPSGEVISNLATPPRLTPMVSRDSISSYLAFSSSSSSTILSMRITSLLIDAPSVTKFLSFGVAVPSSSSPSIPISRSLSARKISSGLALIPTSTPRSRLLRYSSIFNPSMLSTPTTNDFSMVTLKP